LDGDSRPRGERQPSLGPELHFFLARVPPGWAGTEKMNYRSDTIKSRHPRTGMCHELTFS
jgi:hypothetical protein